MTKITRSKHQKQLFSEEITVLNHIKGNPPAFNTRFLLDYALKPFYLGEQYLIFPRQTNLTTIPVQLSIVSPKYPLNTRQ